MKQVFAILLAFVVLFLNVGLTMSSHYCGGEVAKSAFSYGHSDVSCGMENPEEHKEHCEDLASSEKSEFSDNCCNDEFVPFEIGSDYNQLSKIDSKVDFKVIAFVTAYLNILSFEEEEVSNFQLHTPPILAKDYQILNQTFLI